MNIYRILLGIVESLVLPSPIALIVVLLAICVLPRFAPIFYQKVKKYFIVLLVYYFVLSLPVVPNYGLKLLETHYPRAAIETLPKEPNIVVLTAGWTRSTMQGPELHLGEAGWERIEQAVDLWFKLGGKMILTGKLPFYVGRSNAEYMRDIAVAMGVPKDRIIIENKAVNTYQNFLYSKPLLDDSPNLLVTSAWHMPRAMAVAQNMQIDITPVACHYLHLEKNSLRQWFPQTNSLKRLRVVFHEILGIIVYKLRGFA